MDDIYPHECFTIIYKWGDGYYYHSIFSLVEGGERFTAQGTCDSKGACFDAIWAWRDEVIRNASEAEA